MPAVSVIIPVYNVEKYISRCLKSIIGQSLEDIEIIVLNDGSTDKSLDICNAYANLDSRICIYSHPNRGLGPTRNRGIELAHGEYVAFVDSDDFISETGLEALYNKAITQRADVVVAETITFKNEDESSGRVRCSLSAIKDIHLDSSNIHTFYEDYYFPRVYSHNAWDKIYRKEFVLSNHIRFGDNSRVFAEDNWFQLQLLRAFPYICFISETYYWYRQQEESIMHKPKKNLVKRHGNMIMDYQTLIETSEMRHLEKQVCSVVAADIFTLEALNCRNLGLDRKEFLKVIKEVQMNSSLRTSISDLNREEGYKLYTCNKQRMKYLHLIGFLYSIGMFSLAHYLVWLVYFLR